MPSRSHGESVGSFGDVAAWSFCQDKIMSTAGEGSMVITFGQELWDAMWAFKDHGKTREAVFGREHPPGFRWLHERFGSNFRLTELQSAIGRIQLQRLPEWTAARTRNALQLAAALAAGWSHARVASSYIAATAVLAIALLVGGWLWVFGLAGVVLIIGLWLDQRVALAFEVASRS